MIYFLLLCVLFAVTAVSVTATVCAVIGMLTIIEELRKVFRNAFRKSIHKICQLIRKYERNEKFWKKKIR